MMKEMKNKLNKTWMSQPGAAQISRQAALGIPKVDKEQKKPAKKEFISPQKKNNDDRNISPTLAPQILINGCDDSEANLNQLRKASSQIMSGNGSRDFRDRSDSMSAFKKYEKYEKVNNNDMSTPLSNPLISPQVGPSALGMNPNFGGMNIGPSATNNRMAFFQ